MNTIKLLDASHSARSRALFAWDKMTPYPGPFWRCLETWFYDRDTDELVLPDGSRLKLEPTP